MLTRLIQSMKVPRALKIKLLAPTYPVFPSSKHKGIFMWHFGRCGSTVLGKMLNQHPGIRWHGELYNRYVHAGTPRPNFRDDLKYIQMESGQKLPGFELKGLPIQHLLTLGVTLEPFLDVVREYGFSQCIFLDRRNILRRLLSAQIVDQGLRKTYYMSEKQPPLSGRLRIDVQRIRINDHYLPLLDMIRYIEEETEKARHLFSKYFEPVPIYYEDHIETDPRIAYREVLAQLGLPYHDANVMLKRINVKTLQELVENYQEVEDLLAGTKYEWMTKQ